MQETTGWRVFGRTLEPIEDKQRDIGRGRFIGSRVEFFDPLALGLSFEAEFRGGDRWERVIANYLEWPNDFRVQNLADGRERYENKDRWFVIDTKRDHWPIAMNQRHANTVEIQTAIKLTSVDGYWLPSYAAIFVPNETVILQFDWHSVNRPIPKERFTKQDIEARFGS